MNYSSRNIALTCALLLSGSIMAQTEVKKYQPGVTSEGAVYFLPQTALRITVRTEKTVYTPGDFAKYADRYLRLQDVSEETNVSYKVNAVDFSVIGVPDTAKCYAVTFNAKTSATNVVLGDDGILLAINAEPHKVQSTVPFKSAPKPTPVNPRKFMSEEILAAGSNAKMAELTAQEIYDIRESKNLLTRGQADKMPTDGEQLKIMLNHLTEQDNALTQMFSGTITKDTTEQVFVYVPRGEVNKQLLFRFSQRLGLVDKDDLAGSPYYISVVDQKSVPAPAPIEDKKKKKELEQGNGVYVNVPGKIKVTISKGNDVISDKDVTAGQYGYTELLSGELFNKHYTTHLWMDPITGAIDKLEAEQPK